MYKNGKQRDWAANNFTPESSVALLLKTGSECFLHAALGNHRRGRGDSGEVAVDIISRLTHGEEEEEKEEDSEENLYSLHGRNICTITAAKLSSATNQDNFINEIKGGKITNVICLGINVIKNKTFSTWVGQSRGHTRGHDPSYSYFH